jgi:hypothetical protein
MRKYGVSLSILGVAGLFCLGGPCRAENIFEMIFGGGQQSRKAPAAPPQRKAHFSSPARHYAHKKTGQAVADVSDSSPSPETMKLSYAEAWGGKAAGTENCCASARDMIARVTKADPTLRQGDAFMTSDGLQVFVGDRNSDTKFVPVGQAPQLSRALRERLQAMEKTPSASPVHVSSSKWRAQPVSGPLANAGVAEKAAARGSKDRLIETSTGKTIRLVGGYAN